MTLVKDGKADFIQDPPDRCREHCSGILQSGGAVEGGELNSEYSTGREEFIDKGQVGGRWMHNY